MCQELSNPSQYGIITEPNDGHTGQTAGYITLREAKKVLKDASVCVYIFKIPRVRSYCSGPLLKYPLGEFYSCTEINKVQMNMIQKELKH